MLERIVERENMTLAYQRVVGNQGSAGVGGIEVTELKSYLQGNWHVIKEAIQNGSYRPQPNFYRHTLIEILNY